MTYSYKELKGKIKVGDTVRAVEGKRNPCLKLSDNGINTKKITEVDDDGFWIDGCYHFYSEGGYLEIVDEETTWDNVKVGDEFGWKTWGSRYEVVAIVGGVIGFSDEGSSVKWRTREYLRTHTTLIQPNQPRKVTLAEVREKFGEDVIVE